MISGDQLFTGINALFIVLPFQGCNEKMGVLISIALHIPSPLEHILSFRLSCLAILEYHVSIALGVGPPSIP